MPHALGPRQTALEKLAATKAAPLDLLVVGGGITGAGIALDAASRGLKVGLVERNDFASGTSSKSSKLVHGGLRYLEQREFGLIREASTERDLLRRLAPHLVEPIPFVLPVSDFWRRSAVGVGLWAYDALATFRNLKTHKHLDREETESYVPILRKGKVKGGYLFYDCKNDDVRLVMECLVQAVRYGAAVANYLEVKDLTGSDTGCSAHVQDGLTGDTLEIKARTVMVAAGVWADQIEARTRADAEPRLRPSKGIHLVFSRSALPMGDAAAFIPDAQRRRMLFVIPWLDSILVGTTDTTYTGPLDHPSVDADDRRYVIESLNSIFGLALTDMDIAGAFAGLRPLIAGKSDATADLSRRHRVYDIAPNIFGITGGKLTTYRRMAADAVDRVLEPLGGGAKSKTKWIRLGSSDTAALGNAVERRGARLGLERAEWLNLIRAYGDRAHNVLDLAGSEGLTEPLVEGHPPIAAEAAYCAQHEMAVHLNDVLARRTRLALTDPAAGIGDGARATEVMSREHGWRKKAIEAERALHRAEVERERGLPLHPDLKPTPSSDRTTADTG